MQRLPDGAVVPVFGVGDDGGQRHAGRPRAAHQRQGEAPFLLKRDGRGNPRRRARASDRVVHASGRYSKAPMGHARCPVQSAAVTATWQFATLPSAPQYCRATPTECGPDFGKLVSSRIRIPVRSGMTAPQTPPHDLGIPRRMRDEVLERLVRRRLADPLEHRRHRLARAVAQQPVDILAQRHVLRAMAEAVQGLFRPSRAARVVAPVCRGLLSDRARKSMSAMLERVTEPSSYQAFQHFITHAPWDADGACGGGCGRVTPERTGILILDETSFPKTGPPFGRRRAPVLRRAGQSGELPSRGDRRAVDGAAGVGLGRLAVCARGVDARSGATRRRGIPASVRLSREVALGPHAAAPHAGRRLT